MIFVECKPDHALISRLTSVSKQRIEHSFGKTSVLGKLVRRSGSSYENSVGMVDQDPLSYQPKIIKEFTESEIISEFGIRILYYKWLNNRVVVLCPKLEDWIIEAARESGVDMSKYDLPKEAERLHQVINLNIDKFEKLIEVLMEKSARIQKLRQIIEGKQKGS